MQALPIKDSESLSLPTPRANEPGSTSVGYGDSLNDFANRVVKGYALKDLLRTPAASEGERGHQPASKAKARGGQQTLSGQFIDLFPTVNTMEHREIKTPEQIATLKAKSPGGYRNLRESVINEINPPPKWGKFEAAIKHWEIVLGRPAPEPTKPDGKDGNHRLSSKFTEWMMGLPDGWITDIGLKRNDELKACGNGVVPQQAELALSLLGIKEILERS
jgi:DNA (cytosine-5)-methyltransferase 1